MATYAQRFYLEVAAAFVRSRHAAALSEALPQGHSVSANDDDAVLGWALANGVRLHRYKRKNILPRVRQVIGVLRGIAPEQLVDVGSGRGTFLWPLIEALPQLEVTSVEQHPQRAADLRAVSSGGVKRLTVVEEDAQRLPIPLLEQDTADVVTLLEVLEHMPNPIAACRGALQVARSHVVATVPSKEDNNPEHIHLFNRESLHAMFCEAGAARVDIDYIHNHIVVVARVQ